MEDTKQREIWVDNVKVFACVLVVLGHFFQSMIKSDVLPANDLYQWFNQMIYYFHVPLFFICSGYLYQKSGRVNDIHSWLIIPGFFEPPVRILRATIPENESHAFR